MSIEENIRTALLAMSAVAEFNGSGETLTIRPYKLEQDDDHTEPHIVYEIEEDEPQNDITGVGGLRYVDFVITCRASTIAAAKSLAEAVRVNGTNPGTGLAGYGGSGTSFDAVLDSEVRGITLYDDGSDRAWHEVVQTYVVSYSETT